MGPIPTPPEVPRQSEVRTVKSEDASHDLMEEVLRRLAQPSKPSNADLVVDLGQISCLKLPKDWVEGSPQKGMVGNSLFRQFSPPGKSDVALCHYYRGRGMNDEDSKAFHDLLAKPPHNLTASELREAGGLLRDRANPQDFSIALARTEDLNGKRVLVIEGRFKEIQHDVYELFVDADSTNPGKFVQEIYFQAPKDDYIKCRKEAMAALQSIVWK
ncbi:MAG: hypothetical protein HY711_07225 [Candidatus Melainabacteria bacterium]|nr:hypothetical protein [Candidatus Melainabacteria bacterium]